MPQKDSILSFPDGVRNAFEQAREAKRRVDAAEARLTGEVRTFRQDLKATGQRAYPVRRNEVYNDGGATGAADAWMRVDGPGDVFEISETDEPGRKHYVVFHRNARPSGDDVDPPSDAILVPRGIPIGVVWRTAWVYVSATKRCTVQASRGLRPGGLRPPVETMPAEMALTGTPGTVAVDDTAGGTEIAAEDITRELLYVYNRHASEDVCLSFGTPVFNQGIRLKAGADKNFTGMAAKGTLKGIADVGKTVNVQRELDVR